MIEAGILDGDIIVVRKENYAENGDIVRSCLIEDSATVQDLHVKRTDTSDFSRKTLI